MITIRQFTLVCWIIFFLYWLISAGSVKPTQQTRGWLGGNWYPILLLIGALLMGNYRFLVRFGIPIDLLGIRIVLDANVIEVVSAILLIAGLLIAIIARKTLADNWSAAVALKKDHELITIGPYQYVRHPIYTGMLLMILGTAFSLGTLGAWIGFLIIVLAIWLKLKREEMLLTEHFAEKYSSYKKRTKILIPFIW